MSSTGDLLEILTPGCQGVAAGACVRLWLDQVLSLFESLSGLALAGKSERTSLRLSSSQES